ncbi:MAG TPA: NAD(P)H-dependent oxidoreductase, partial [Cytophagaceae bacterium]|nr:NAD(P)H-dependent oxidoreductase [Cytophagaceae bacterium]
MPTKKKILAISGSTRKNSSNSKLLSFIKNLSSDIFEITIFEEIDQLPHFNPDLDNENAPSQVIAFRKQISNAD